MPLSVDLELQVPMGSADPLAVDSTTGWVDVCSASIPLRESVTKLSTHCVFATGVRLTFLGRRADNKLNVVALNNVVVLRPNASSVYTPTLSVLADLQQWLLKVSRTHSRLWAAAVAASLQLGMSSASLVSLLRVLLSVVAIDGGVPATEDDTAIAASVWADPLPEAVVAEVNSATAVIKVGAPSRALPGGFVCSTPATEVFFSQCTADLTVYVVCAW